MPLPSLAPLLPLRSPSLLPLVHLSLPLRFPHHDYDLLNIYNLMFTDMTLAEQRALLRARAFPETTLDRLAII
jgi:hypothetical protein